MSTLSIHTWFLITIIPLTIILQGCYDDCSPADAAAAAAGVCKRDMTAVAEGKECSCGENTCKNVQGSTVPAEIAKFCTTAGVCAPTAPSTTPACDVSSSLVLTKQVAIAPSGGCICGTLATVCAENKLCTVINGSTDTCTDTIDFTAAPLVPYVGTTPLVTKAWGAADFAAVPAATPICMWTVGVPCIHSANAACGASGAVCAGDGAFTITSLGGGWYTYDGAANASFAVCLPTGLDKSGDNDVAGAIAITAGAAL